MLRPWCLYILRFHWTFSGVGDYCLKKAGPKQVPVPYKLYSTQSHPATPTFCESEACSYRRSTSHNPCICDYPRSGSECARAVAWSCWTPPRTACTWTRAEAAVPTRRLPPESRAPFSRFGNLESLENLPAARVWCCPRPKHPDPRPAAPAAVVGGSRILIPLEIRVRCDFCHETSLWTSTIRL